MDTLRGGFEAAADTGGYDLADDEEGRENPPAAIGNDERRMQVRAYKHWASLLSANRNFPAIDELNTADLPDFGPFSVLLDFTQGMENPGIAFLGDELALECGAEGAAPRSLADVHSRSLVSRITDHYMQILANQAPIGFEAEFVNQRGATILYRGILLPFSSDDDTIDFIYGVINWKELADQQHANELLLEIDQALQPTPARAPSFDAGAPLTDWADGPGAFPANDLDEDELADESDDELADGVIEEEEGDTGLAAMLRKRLMRNASPSFDEDDEDGDESGSNASYGSLLKTAIQFPDAPAQLVPYEPDDGDHTQIVLAIDPAEMELGDWLAAAREMAAAARTSEERTRQALYEAIGLAYDFSLAAAQVPEEFVELLADAGVARQERAPMTPVVKLVFGADYDKTRLTEYAAALAHAHRLKLGQGILSGFLAEAEGGLKGVVTAERRLRRDENGKTSPAAAPRQALARQLRTLAGSDFATLSAQGNEFALVLIRRSDNEGVMMLGEVPDDAALVDKAARRLLG